MSVSTLAPVVVKPDIASKNASTGRASCASPDEEVRQRAERGGDEPRERDDEEALARADALLPSREPLERRAPTPAHDRARGQERPDGLAVPERDRRRERGRRG